MKTIIIALLVLFASLALAQQPSRWSRKTLQTPYDRRTITFIDNICSVSLRATRLTTARLNRIDVIQWQLNGGILDAWLYGPDLRLAYFDSDKETTTAFTMRVILRALVEFNDSNGDGVFEDGVDQVVNTIPLWGRFPNIPCLRTSMDKIDNETTVYSVSSNISLPESDGFFSLSLVFSTADVFDKNVTLTPNTMKFDITVGKFPWKRNNTKLALRSFVISNGARTKSKMDYDPSNSDVPANKDGIVVASSTKDVKLGFFSWESHVYNGNVSGRIIEVKVSKEFASDNTTIDIDHDETIGMIYFTLADAPTDYIYWDPYIGVQEEGSSSEAPPLLSLGAIIGIVIGGIAVICIIVGVVIYFSRRSSYQPV